MRQFSLEFFVGLFVIAGLICLTYLSVKLGDLDWVGEDSYDLTAKFVSVSGLKEGAFVEIAGVRVGTVHRLELDQEYYEAKATLRIDNEVKIQEDAIASVRTQGIIGDKFIKISPGGSDIYLEEGMEIVETEPAISLEELLSKYIFEGDR